MIHRATVAEMRAGVARAVRETGRLSAHAFTRGSLELRFYAPEKVDRQVPHDRDELYFVVAGSGRFTVDGESVPFGPGDALWAGAGQVHRFEDFSGDIAIWVVFYGPKGGEGR